jgi:hypothetical protein
MTPLAGRVRSPLRASVANQNAFVPASGGQWAARPMHNRLDQPLQLFPLFGGVGKEPLISMINTHEASR